MDAKPASREERVQPRKENARRETGVRYVRSDTTSGPEAVKIACSYVLLLFMRKRMCFGSSHILSLGVKKVKVKVKQSRYRPGVAQRFPGS